MIPKTLVLMLTNKCNFYCDHCSVCAGPDENEVLADEIIKKAIDQAYLIPSIKVVAFTGGEVTLYREKLKKSIAYAHNKGLLTRIVTNAWWADTIEKARIWCNELVACGLNEINISYDDFHALYLAKFGGEQNIINVVQAAKEAKLNLLIGIVMAPNSKITGKYLREIVDREIQYFEGQIAPFGRAREVLPDNFFSVDKNINTCDDAGASLVVLPTAKVAFCCGHSLFSEAEALFIVDTLKSNSSLIDILELIHKNVLIWFIYLNGPVALFKELGIKEKIRNSCEACFYLGTKYKANLLELAKKKKELFQGLEKKYKREH